MERQKAEVLEEAGPVPQEKVNTDHGSAILQEQPVVCRFLTAAQHAVDRRYWQLVSR